MKELERLEQVIKRKQAIREQFREIDKIKSERDKLINSASQTLPNCNFFCLTCSKDFVATGVKCVESDWTDASQRIAYYKGKCPQGHKAIRRITDKQLDPYFIKSNQLKRERINHKRALLQKNDYGFRVLYNQYD